MAESEIEFIDDHTTNDESVDKEVELDPSSTKTENTIKQTKSTELLNREHTKVNDRPLSEASDLVHVKQKAKSNFEQKPKSTTDIDQSFSLVTYAGDSENYDLSKKLPADSRLVKDQTHKVEELLRLNVLSKDLSCLSKFVHLACCGVVGHTDLEIETREVLLNVGEITDDTFHALQKFEGTSDNALQTMQAAYGF